MKNYIVLDTETAPTCDCPRDNSVHANCSNVYDLGYIIVTEEGTIKRSFVITDTFFNDSLMRSAYYADKMPQHWNGMYTEWQPVSMLAAYRQFCEDCKTYGIKEVWAYNANFDKQALNRTIKDASNGSCNRFFPYGIEIRDIWDYAGNTICNTKKYVKWCNRNGYITASGNPSTSAEIVYRYITGTEFVEQHTALADAEIENEILQAAKRRKKKSPTTCGQGWRSASKIKKSLS